MDWKCIEIRSHPDINLTKIRSLLGIKKSPNPSKSAHNQTTQWDYPMRLLNEITQWDYQWDYPMRLSNKITHTDYPYRLPIETTHRDYPHKLPIQITHTDYP